MASNPPPSAEDCAALMLDVIPAVMRTIRARMRGDASVELTVVQFRALVRADRRGGGGASVSEIAEHVGLTLPSASKLVQGLARRGYFRRSAHPSDRRVSIVTLTPKGHRALESARRAARQHLAGMLRAVPPRQRAQFAAGLTAIRPIFVVSVPAAPT
jgi:DNA-binding MarR family transcriptional regulator